MTKGDSRFTFWSELRNFELRALIADCFVFTTAALAIGLIAYKACFVSLKISLQRVAVGVLLMCLGLAYFASLLRGTSQDRRWATQLERDEVTIYWEYDGPLWLARLAGTTRYANGAFDRVRAVELSPEAIDASGQVQKGLSELSRLRSLEGRYWNWTDHRLQMLLAADEHWPVTTLHFHGKQVSSAGLLDIDHCPDLQVANFDDTQVDDQLVERLCLCHHLEALQLNGTQITGRSVPLFARMKSLKKLEVVGCKRLTDDDVARLERLPGVRVRASNE